MKKVNLIIVHITITLITVISGFGQNGKIDSLKKELDKNPGDTLRIHLLLSLAYNHWSISPERMHEYLEQAERLLTKTDYPNGKARLSNIYGIYYWTLGDYKNTLKHYSDALDQEEQNKYPKRAAIIKINIAQVYLHYGNYPKSLEYFTQALKYLEQIDGPKDHIAEIYNGIGNVYEELKQYETAIQNYQRAFSYANEMKDSVAMAGFNCNIGNIFLKTGDIEKSITYQNRALDLYTRFNNVRGQVSVNERLARCYYSKKDFGISSGFAKTAFQQASQLGAYSICISALNILGNNHLAIHEYARALSYFNQALKFSENYGSTIDKLETLKGLSQVHASLQQYDSAYKFQENYTVLSDSIFSGEANRRLSQIQVDYDLAKKDEEIQILMRDKEIQNLFKYLLISVLIIVAITIAFIVNRMRKERLIMQKEKKVLELELKNKELENIRLEQEIEFKSKELTNHTLNLIQKNTFLDELKESITNLKNTPTDQMAKKINALLIQINHSFRLDKDWETFKRHFEHVNEDFFNRLRLTFPDLTPQELKLCALAKLDLSNKEVATLLGITTDSVKVARSRLRKKLQLPTDQKITHFLVELANTTHDTLAVHQKKLKKEKEYQP